MRVFIGTKPCGCQVAVAVDEERWRNETAKDVADWIRQGLSVSTVELSSGEELDLKGCPHRVQEPQP